MTQQNQIDRHAIVTALAALERLRDRDRWTSTISDPNFDDRYIPAEAQGLMAIYVLTRALRDNRYDDNDQERNQMQEEIDRMTQLNQRQSTMLNDITTMSTMKKLINGIKNYVNVR